MFPLRAKKQKKIGPRVKAIPAELPFVQVLPVKSNASFDLLPIAVCGHENYHNRGKLP